MMQAQQVGPIEAKQRMEAAASRRRLLGVNPAPPRLAVVKPQEAPAGAIQRPLVAFDNHVLAYKAQTSGVAYVLYQLRERGLTLDDLRSPGRAHEMVMLRGELAHTLKTKFGWSYPGIGAHMHRDHSSIHHCVAKYCCLTGAPRAAAQVRRLVTADQMDDLRRLVTEGTPISNAARQCGLTVSTAIRRAVDQGWYVIAERPGAKRKNLPFDVIEQQYISGVRLKDIAAQYGVSERSVRRLVYDFGWAKRKREAKREHV